MKLKKITAVILTVAMFLSALVMPINAEKNEGTPVSLEIIEDSENSPLKGELVENYTTDKIYDTPTFLKIVKCDNAVGCFVGVNPGLFEMQSSMVQVTLNYTVMEIETGERQKLSVETNWENGAAVLTAKAEPGWKVINAQASANFNVDSAAGNLSVSV